MVSKVFDFWAIRVISRLAALCGSLVADERGQVKVPAKPIDVAFNKNGEILSWPVVTNGE